MKKTLRDKRFEKRQITERIKNSTQNSNKDRLKIGEQLADKKKHFSYSIFNNWTNKAQ